jgi:peroxiredoxin
MIFVLFLLLVLILISLWAGFYAIVKQQGRILLRLDQLEQNPRLASAEPKSAAAPVEPEGLAVGTEFPAFRFPDLAGKTVALEDFRGKRVLLLYWSFECGFCDSIAPDLAAFETRLEEANVALVLLAYGEAAANQKRAAEHGLQCPILLLKDEEVPKPFEHQGTPVAYLLDEEGRVDAPFASGADRILSLAKALVSSSPSLTPRDVTPPAAVPDAGPNAVRQQAGLPSPQAPAPAAGRHRVKLPRFMVEGEIGLGDVIKRVTSTFGIKPCVGCERRAALLNRWMSFSGETINALKPGAPAPLFRLPDLQGRMIAMEEYRGRRVLLVFTDPQCGPCDELAPFLVGLHSENDKKGLAVVIVGRGNPEANRRKAEQHGFQFPVVIQPKWKLSKEYGTLATPVAFLIGEDGLLAAEVAAGKEPIIALAQAAAKALTSHA